MFKFIFVNNQTFLLQLTAKRRTGSHTSIAQTHNGQHKYLPRADAMPIYATNIYTEFNIQRTTQLFTNVDLA